MSKSRWILLTTLAVMSFLCALSVWRLGAANPTSGAMLPNSIPLSWAGTAAGGTNNGEGTCVEGVNCDTFTLTISGTPADWAGKRIQVAMSWIVLANDYDLYIHKTDNSGPVVDQSAHGAPATSETAYIDPAADGTGVFTVHAVYFTGSAADQYHCVATVVPAFPQPPPPPPLSHNWTINYHGECCEGNLSASGPNTYVLLPVLVQGNKIKKSSDGGQTWTQKYPPAPASVPFGIEGDMQAFGDDVVFFGTELGVAIVAHSNDAGENFIVSQIPLASAGNDQAWSYLGPFGDMRPGGPLPTDEPYVLAGWMRIGASVIFSFDGGLTFPIQTPLAGNDGSGPIHVVCRNSAHAPNNPGDTRIPNANFASHKAGRHGGWGTDRKFYWTEPADGTNPGDRDLYVCKTGDFGANWTGIKHPIPFGQGSGFVVSHSAFDNNGTFYVLHGDRLYVSFNQGESFAFVHTLPRFGNAGRSDSGSDQFFVVDCGTIHVGLLADAGEGRGNVFYLRGSNVDTATPTWDEELVDQVDNVRLDFMYIVLDGNGVPTISYTTPGTGKQVTTASRKLALPTGCVHPLSAVSRKTHGIAGTFDVNLPLVGTPGVECRTGGTNKDYTIVVTFPAALNGVSSVSVTQGSATVNTNSGIGPGPNQYTVNLTGVTNAQHLGITLFGVHDAVGNVSNSITVPMDVLIGDVNAVAGVSGSDVNLCKAQVGAELSNNNFRSDINTTGFVSGADVNLIKAQVGTTLP
jgi:hypothetical protein